MPLGMSWVHHGSTDLSRTGASGAVEGPAIGNVAVDSSEKRICTGIMRDIGGLLEEELRLTPVRGKGGSFYYRVAR